MLNKQMPTEKYTTSSKHIYLPSIADFISKVLLTVFLRYFFYFCYINFLVGFVFYFYEQLYG